MSLSDTAPEFCEVFMLQSACIHKMQTQIKPPVNRQKPDILGNQPQTPFSHSLPSTIMSVWLSGNCTEKS